MSIAFETLFINHKAVYASWNPNEINGRSTGGGGIWQFNELLNLGIEDFDGNGESVVGKVAG